ncbi:MAG: ribose transporter permease [Bacilli bacterium]|nr:ribose transporter permease [Bacilli bacterium]
MKTTNSSVISAVKQLDVLGSGRFFLRENGSFISFVGLWLIAMLTVPHFASLDNNLLIIKQSAIPIIACMGMTLVLIIGGIDLSIGFIVGFASILSGILVKTYGLPIPFAIGITVLTGLLIGSGNGIIIEKIKVPSFIATLGSGYIIYGLAQIISGGNVVNQLPKQFLAYGNTEVFLLPLSVYICLIIVCIHYILLHQTTFGRSLFSSGFNRNASLLSGIQVGKYTIFTYAISGTLASVVGILLTIRVNSAQPDMGGSSFTFEIITAAVIGGTSLFGGSGKILGSLFGVLIIKMIENCINLLGISHYMYQAFMGLIILIAIILENMKNRALT